MFEANPEPPLSMLPEGAIERMGTDVVGQLPLGDPDGVRAYTIEEILHGQQ